MIKISFKHTIHTLTITHPSFWIFLGILDTSKEPPLVDTVVPASSGRCRTELTRSSH